MPQVTQAYPHLDLEAVKQRVKLAQLHWERQKWLVIYNAYADPRAAAEIALHVGVSRMICQKSNSAIQPSGRNGVINTRKRR